MNQSERDAVGTALMSLAFLFGSDQTKDRISLFITTLEKFMPATGEQYLLAIQKYSEDHKNKFFPTPVQLRPYLLPEMSIEAKANECASRTRKAVADFGHSNPTEARAYVGELAWRAIERFGGWSYICENLGVELQPLTFHAQLRDVIKGMIESIAVDQFDKPIGIEGPRQSTGTLQRVDPLKLLEDLDPKK